MRDYFTALNSAKSWYTGDVFMIELPASSNSFRHVRELNLTTDQGRMVKATDLCTIQEKGK